jgi:hypothetical protein
VDLFLHHFGRRARGMVSQGERPINYNQYKVPLIEKLVKLGDPRCRVGRHRRYRGARHPPAVSLTLSKRMQETGSKACTGFEAGLRPARHRPANEPRNLGWRDSLVLGRELALLRSL